VEPTPDLGFKITIQKFLIIGGDLKTLNFLSRGFYQKTTADQKE
jgi:hypothetical protein